LSTHSDNAPLALESPAREMGRAFSPFWFFVADSPVRYAGLGSSRAVGAGYFRFPGAGDCFAVSNRAPPWTFYLPRQ
jgi:hypothetical protein